MTSQELQNRVLQLPLHERWQLVQQILTSIQHETVFSGSPSEEDLVFENGRSHLVQASEPTTTGKFGKLRGIATTPLSTDEIMSLTRER